MSDSARSLWSRLWRVGISFSWRFGGPTDDERQEQERRADELRRQNERGFTIRDKRNSNDEE